MNYVDVAQARTGSGLRLVLSVGVPGPWGEAAKGILYVKGLTFTPVAQTLAMPNDELRAWTGHRNAPIAIIDGESPRADWAAILLLAERLAPTPPLVPDAPSERALMFGLAREICGERGLGWCRRLIIIDDSVRKMRDLPAAHRAPMDLLATSYGYDEAAAAAAPSRVAEILALLAGQLATQQQRGRRYLVGDRLSALDVYWATFAALIAPLPPEQCPMGEDVRAWYGTIGPVVAAAVDPALLAHRDFVYRTHLQLPLDF
jgi:glutathione S-transferase